MPSIALGPGTCIPVAGLRSSQTGSPLSVPLTKQHFYQTSTSSLANSSLSPTDRRQPGLAVQADQHGKALAVLSQGCFKPHDNWPTPSHTTRNWQGEAGFGVESLGLQSLPPPHSAAGSQLSRTSRCLG